jgi:hypothetical protein
VEFLWPNRLPGAAQIGTEQMGTQDQFPPLQHHATGATGQATHDESLRLGSESSMDPPRREVVFGARVVHAFARSCALGFPGVRPPRQAHVLLPLLPPSPGAMVVSRRVSRQSLKGWWPTRRFGDRGCEPTICYNVTPSDLIGPNRTHFHRGCRLAPLHRVER